eukprot:GHVQ01004543.1.p1 GENE.GHVQ01004543.1~~GHVQ01004543.1.p1  ORF type:complete len:314 (+),score=44.81 GHVQ01004543.1:115-1056(+)
MVGLVCRNVTSVYLKYRTEHKNKKNRFGSSILGGYSPTGGETTGQQRLLTHVSEDEGEEIEMVSHLPPVWVDIVDDCRDDINRIKAKMSQVQKAQQKRLLKVFEDNSGGQPDKELDALTVSITQLFKKCENRLHQIKVRNAEDMSNAEVSQRKNAQMSIATQLQCLNQAFRKQQTQYITEVKRRQKGSDLFESKTAKSSTLAPDGGFSDQLMVEVDNMEEDVGQRSEELANIAKSVAELHSIFKNLAVMVIDQGTILDRIDYNVEQVVVQTSNATVQLRKAEEKQKSSRAARCITILITMIFVMIAILIIKHV